MKVYIILGSKLLFIWALVYYFTLPSNQMHKHDATSICLNS